MENDIGARLHNLSTVMRHLHKALIDVETQYFGAVGSALEHLQLVTQHPHFAWLQKLSGLLTELDERLDEPDTLDDGVAAAFRTAVEQLVGPRTASDADFRKRYTALLHDSPEVVMAHGALRRALEALPAQPDPDK